MKDTTHSPKNAKYSICEVLIISNVEKWTCDICVWKVISKFIIIQRDF